MSHNLPLTVETFLKKTLTYNQFNAVHWMSEATTLRYMLQIAYTLHIESQLPIYIYDAMDMVQICASGGFPIVDHDKVEAIATQVKHLLLDVKFDRGEWTEYPN